MTVSSPSLPVVNPDFHDPAFVADPYPVFEQIRAAGRIVRHADLDLHLVTGYRDVTRVLSNTDAFGSDHDMMNKLFGAVTMEGMDNPRHDEVRSAWAKDFQRGSLESRRAMVEAIVAPQVGAFATAVRAGETPDAVTRLTRPIPTLVIGSMLDIPDADIGRFIGWSDTIGGILRGHHAPTDDNRRYVDDGIDASHALGDYLRDRLDERRGGSGTDLISTMVNAPVAATMTDAEMVGSNTQLVFAGNETTSKLMGQILIALARHPGQRALLREDRSLIPRAIEEIHRFATVIVYSMRFALVDDAPLAEITVPRGSTVMVIKAAANRDPERWERPDVLDITRAPKPNVGFGFGIHTCLGMNLARLELEVWLNHMLDELPDWTVPDDIYWGGNWMVRGPLSLPIVTG